MKWVVDEKFRKVHGSDLGSLGKKMGSFTNDVGALVAVDREAAVKGLELWKWNSEIRRDDKRWVKGCLILG